MELLYILKRSSSLRNHNKWLITNEDVLVSSILNKGLTASAVGSVASWFKNLPTREHNEEVCPLRAAVGQRRVVVCDMCGEEMRRSVLLLSTSSKTLGYLSSV